jgi:hypothetical protein
MTPDVSICHCCHRGHRCRHELGLILSGQSCEYSRIVSLSVVHARTVYESTSELWMGKLSLALNRLSLAWQSVALSS